MHRSSYDKMSAFRDAYLGHLSATPLTILDVGSAAVSADHSGYRPLFSAAQWRYVGLDVQPGPNVDMVVSDPYRWSELQDASVDVVISGQAFEHIEWPWLTIREIARVLRPNGIAAITAPSAGPVHRFPRDCWRYYPDGLPALAAYARPRVVEHHWDDGYAYPENAFWGEAFCRDSFGQGTLSLGIGGIPSRSATFFWISTMISARASCLARRAFSFCAAASWAARGLGSAIFGPRLAGASAPLVAASRALRQSVRLDE